MWGEAETSTVPLSFTERAHTNSYTHRFLTVYPSSLIFENYNPSNAKLCKYTSYRILSI